MVLYELDAVGNRTGEKRVSRGVVTALTVAAFAALSPAQAGGALARQHNAVDWVLSVDDVEAGTSKRFEYDGWNAMVRAEETRSTSGTQAVSFVYDTSHRLHHVTRGLAQVSYGYSSAFPRLRASKTVTGASPISYSYDSFGRLSSVVGPWGTTAVGWEDGGSRLTTLGTDETFSYDGRGWLQSVTTPFGVRRYTYDGRGNRTTESFDGAVRAFAYDDADRLVAVREWDGRIDAWDLKPDGTKAGERSWPAGTPFTAGVGMYNTTNPAPSRAVTYSYDTRGALTEVAGASGPEVTYERDPLGQAVSRTVGGVKTTYGWDVDGRLVSASRPLAGANPALEVRYDYDALGLRRQATVTETPLAPAAPVTVTRNWQWGGADGEEEASEDGNTTLHIAGYRVGDGPTRFWHDGLGSVVSQTVGGNTTSIEYSAWGTRTTAGPVPSSAGFTGHRFESALGLTYAEQRWLDSSTGTWLSRDPVGASSYLARPNDLYAFGYAAGNPARFADPDGRCLFEPGFWGPWECIKSGAADIQSDWGELTKWARGTQGPHPSTVTQPVQLSISLFNENTWKANEEARWRAAWNSYITDMPAPTSGDAADILAWKQKREWARATEGSMQAIDTGARMYLQYVAIPYLTAEVGGVVFEGAGLLSSGSAEELALTRNLARLESITDKQVLQAQVRIAVSASRQASATSGFGAFVQRERLLLSQRQMSTVGDYYAAAYGPGEYAGMGVELEAGPRMVRFFHGTSSNRASKIVSSGFKPGRAAFLAEESATAEYFARESLAHYIPAFQQLPSSFSVVEFSMSEDVAASLGLTKRWPLGEFYELPMTDIAGGSGFERILTSSERVKAFNEALRAGKIAVRRRKL